MKQRPDTHIATVIVSARAQSEPAAGKSTARYLADEAFLDLQRRLMEDPSAGDLIERAGRQFWLFTIYDKNEATDLTPNELKRIREMIKAELRERRAK